MSRIQCSICPHNCRLETGQLGICRARSNRGDAINCNNYGQITSLALDPIEKKPFYHFYPGSKILSVGSYGCNLRCPFCQNHEISMADEEHAETVYVSPDELVQKALRLVPSGNIGVAFTYNEPLIGYEYVLDCARLLKKHDLKVVLVTNGYINEPPFLELLPFIDAMNIDLKAFSEAFYHKLGGHLEPVKQSIALAHDKCHVEVTTLIVPGENDSPAEMRELSNWLAKLDDTLPLHITRFFPRHKMSDREPTSIDTVYSLAEIARERLKYVYEGNC